MNRIYKTICQYHMISPGDRVIAGVSGGADSVCLLRALAGYRGQVPFTLLWCMWSMASAGRKAWRMRLL